MHIMASFVSLLTLILTFFFVNKTAAIHKKAQYLSTGKKWQNLKV